jgi:hypothetical protein
MLDDYCAGYAGALEKISETDPSSAGGSEHDANIGDEPLPCEQACDVRFCHASLLKPAMSDLRNGAFRDAADVDLNVLAIHACSTRDFSSEILLLAFPPQDLRHDEV